MDDTKIENELNRLTSEVEKHNKTSNNSNLLYNINLQKIVIPFIVILLLFIGIKPKFICDFDNTTKTYVINIQKCTIWMFCILSIIYSVLFYKYIPYINNLVSKLKSN